MISCAFFDFWKSEQIGLLTKWFFSNALGNNTLLIADFRQSEQIGLLVMCPSMFWPRVTLSKTLQIKIRNWKSVVNQQLVKIT